MKSQINEVDEEEASSPCSLLDPSPIQKLNPKLVEDI